MKPANKGEPIQITDLVAALESLSPLETGSSPKSSVPTKEPSLAQTRSMEERISSRILAPLEIDEFRIPSRFEEDIDLSLLLTGTDLPFVSDQAKAVPVKRRDKIFSRKRIAIAMIASAILAAAIISVGSRGLIGDSMLPQSSVEEASPGLSGPSEESVTSVTTRRFGKEGPSSRASQDVTPQRSGLDSTAQPGRPQDPPVPPACNASAGDICLHAPDLPLQIPIG